MHGVETKWFIYILPPYLTYWPYISIPYGYTCVYSVRYENSALKAQVRQYRRKVQKIQRLAYTAVQRDDNIHDITYAALEDATNLPPQPVPFESDSEDDKPCNKVVYRSAKDLHSEK